MKLGQRNKVFLFTFSLLFLSVSSLTVLFFYKEHRTEQLQQTHKAEDVISFVASASPHIFPPDTVQLNIFLSEVIEENDLLWAYLVNEQGDAVAGRGLDTTQTLPTAYRAFVIEATTGDTLRTAAVGNVFVAAKPVYRETVRVGTIWTGKTILSLYDPLSSIWVYVGGGLLLFGLFALFFFVRTMFKPLEGIVTGIHAITDGDYDFRIPAKSKDEYRVLAVSVNRIAQTMKAWKLELAQASEHTNNIIRSMVDMLLVVSPNGNIRMANAATCKKLHYKQNELTGQPVQHIIPEFPFEMFTPERLEIEGFIHDLEIFYMSKNRKLFPVSFSASAMRDEHGHLVGVVCVAQDITERKRYERELIEAKEEAEEMSRLKSAFLANMSHEIRTPLTSILGYAQILVEEVPDDIREFADMIARGGRRLHDTLNSVLELARLEANERKLTYENIDVSAEIQDTLKLFASTAQEKNLKLHGPKLMATYAHVDRVALNRIISNLVGNAIKFTDEGHVIVRMRANDRWLELLIEDTGIGINQEFLPHIFDEFKQESTGEARSYEGSGLGLTITQKLIALHKGTIQVKSKEGKGTSFLVRLPRTHPELKESVEPLGSPVPAGDGSPVGRPTQRSTQIRTEPGNEQPRLLIVEDNPETRKLLLHELSNQYLVDAVSTGGEAINLARQNHYHLIVMDINLGSEQRSGTDIMHLLRKVPRYQTIPFVAVTAYALPGDEKRFLQEGFTAYVSKPFEMNVLQDTLLKLTKRT